MFVLDTNILIYYAANDRLVVEFLERNESNPIYIPTIVVAEFLSFRLITPTAVRIFEQFEKQAYIFPLDLSVAHLAAQIRKESNLKLADAIIAATALVTGSAVVTRNVRDFRKVRDLLVINP